METYGIKTDADLVKIASGVRASFISIKAFILNGNNNVNQSSIKIRARHPIEKETQSSVLRLCVLNVQIIGY